MTEQKYDQKSKHIAILINTNNKITKSNFKFIPIQHKSVIVHVCLFYPSFVCMSAYANVYFKTTIIKQNIKTILLQSNIHVSEVYCGSAVRFGQALPGFSPYYCTPLVCISVVIGLLAVWRHNKTKPKPKPFCDWPSTGRQRRVSWVLRD